MDSTSVNSSTAAELDSDRTKKTKSSDTPSQDDLEKIPMLPILPTTTLGEDELSLIFSDPWLSTRDLLTFRLVNKSWRDAATSALLRRDACYISLDNEMSHFLKHGDKTRTLTELTDLMLKSPKFPASNLHILISVNAERSRVEVDYSNYPVLLMFFKLHGDKIKTLSPRGLISPEAILDILSIYTPNIECLHLEEARLWRSDSKKKDEKKETNSSNKGDSKWIIPVKSLIIGDGCRYNRQTVHLLLSSFPKLCSIENNIETLPHILSEGKGHLVRSFKHQTYAGISSAAYVSQLQKFAGVNPQLFSLSLNMKHSCLPAVAAINALLESSKDTLQKLELTTCPFNTQTRLKISPMPNLKSVILSVKHSLRGIIEGQQVDEDGAYSVWEDGMSAQKCFPGLVKLRLINVTVENGTMRFFQFKLERNGTVKNCLPNVQVLEILASRLPTNPNPDYRLLSKFFPNLRMVKIDCGDFRNCTNSFWLLFPSVEFLEIHSISCDGFSGDLSIFTDMFFTGFSPEVCMKLGTTELPQFQDQALGLKFLRMTPSVCDLLHLKELKLKFSGILPASFASLVTGIYAFLQMPNTRFIISYDPKKLKIGTEKKTDMLWATEVCFGSIKPYVQIVHEKQERNNIQIMDE